MTTGIFTPTPRTGPNGETWAGRGRKPKWLKELEAAKAVTATPAASVTTDAPVSAPIAE